MLASADHYLTKRGFDFHFSQLWTDGGLGGEMFVAQGSSCKEKGNACKGAESTCDPESSLIIPGMCPNEARAASSQGRPKLMGCNDPSINDSGIFATEAVRGES
jgi:hypothetical protein